ncbi:MAG: pentapeptide repeat-containing protein [Thalassovita sp.]
MTLTVVVVFVALVILGTAIWMIWQPSWMGFQEKSLWNWLAMFANSFGIALGTAAVSLTILKVEARANQELYLQTYIDRIAALVLEQPQAELSEAARVVGQAQTAAILHTIDGERAGRVLVFLDGLSLMQTFEFSLEERDFTGAELKAIDFSGLDFEDSKLRRADLERSQFRDADLEGTDLRRADLKNANLRGADLNQARLARAELEMADLRGAQMVGATGLKAAQLALACADATTHLPKGMTLSASNGEACAAIDRLTP